MKTLVTLLFFILCANTLSAQALHVDSTRFITGINQTTDILFSIPTVDNGILFVGEDYGNPGGIIPYFPLDTVLSNVMIGKIDSNHQISWIKIYGGSYYDFALSACQTPDGGYAVFGNTSSDDGDVTTARIGGLWLVRIDANGNLLWENRYGSSASDGAISIANTPDHGFILLGVTDGSDGDVPFHYGSFYTFDWLVVKTDSIGNKQWSRDLGGTGNEQQTGAILAIDSFYYLVSGTNSTDYNCTDSFWHPGVNTGYDYYMLKLDTAGNVLWDSSYGGGEGDVAGYAMFDNRDSTIMITGSTSSDDYMVTGYHECIDRGGDFWVVKLNKQGQLLWQKTLGSVQQEAGTSICTAPNNGYMALGHTQPQSCSDTTIGDIGLEDCWLFAIDSLGNILTNKIFGGVNIEEPCSIISHLNGYAVSGLSASAIFTEGSTYGNFDFVGGAFISYLEYWPLNVKEINRFSEQIIVYPNPANESINIDFYANENGQLTISNILGKAIYTESIVSGTQNEEIQIKNWPEGVYFIKWQSENGEILTTKLIKN